jgi:hypothetical protein
MQQYGYDYNYTATASATTAFIFKQLGMESRRQRRRFKQHQFASMIKNYKGGMTHLISFKWVAPYLWKEKNVSNPLHNNER